MSEGDPFPLNLYSWILPFDMIGNVSRLIEEGTLPDPKILYSGFGVGFTMTIVRLVLSYTIFQPLGRKAMGLGRISTLKPIQELDKLFNPKRKPSDDEVKAVCEISGITLAEGKKYLREKKINKATAVQLWKFNEAMWRALLYFIMVIVGVLCTCSQPWFRDPFSSTWIGWPYQMQPIQTYWYYALSMGVYIHLMMFQVFDTKRSDLWQHVLHHIVTLFLIVLSWITNFVRIGTLVVLLHDVSDVPLEVAKVVNYTKKNPKHTWWASPAADIIFATFAVTFIVTRLGLYPYFILYNTMFVAEYAAMYPGGKPPRPPVYWLFNAMLVILQLLHILWSYLILKVIYRVIVLKKLEDVRSDDEIDKLSEDEGKKKKN